VGAILDGLLSERPLSGGLSVGRLARSWEAVVGARLAAETVPARLEGGTLVVAATTGPWGAQVRFLAKDILRRANEMLGSEGVRRVQVVVATGGGKRG
jgi:hypothetical protein